MARARDVARREGGPAAPKRTAKQGREGGSNSVVESQPSKLLVAGSIPVSRSSLRSMDTGRATAGKLSAFARWIQDELRLASWKMAADLSAVARRAKADVAQLAERVLGKDEVTSSILVIGSNLRTWMPAKVVRRSFSGGGPHAR